VRIRLRFSKLGKIRFTGHRDVARIWERTVRRAALPVARTEGFAPRPRMHFGLALSTGYESTAEYLDIDLAEPEAAGVDLSLLPEQLSHLLPPGLRVDALEELPPGATSLQQAVTSCTWRMELPGVPAAHAGDQVRRLLDAPSLVVTRERKGQPVTDDLRPALLDLTVQAGSDGLTVLEAELATQPRGVRPAELVALFDPPHPDPIDVGGRVCRTHQWISDDGAKREPLAAPDATSPAHAEVRAS
jgi:radical SAM-linked protein